MQSKECTECKVDKDIVNFSKMKKGKYGVRSVCKECIAIQAKEYRQRPERLQVVKDYYENNRTEFRIRMNKYRMTLVGQYHEYLKSAKKRNYEFLLSKDDCLSFFNTDCYYCNGKINGLGIDRIDNDKGYTLDNVVPCCYRCNIMKHTSTQESFLSHIKQILDNMQSKV